MPGKLASDLRLGFAAFLAVTVPVYLVWIDAEQLLPHNVIPDPIAIFFLSLALGTLYYRTHRILPCIVLHAVQHGGGRLGSLVVAGMSVLYCSSRSA